MVKDKDPIINVGLDPQDVRRLKPVLPDSSAAGTSFHVGQGFPGSFIPPPTDSSPSPDSPPETEDDAKGN